MPKIEEAKKKKVKEIPDLGQSLTEYRVEGGGTNLIYHLDTRCTSNNRLGGFWAARNGRCYIRSPPPPHKKKEKSKMTVDILLGIGKPVGIRSQFCRKYVSAFLGFLPFPDVICILEPVW